MFKNRVKLKVLSLELNLDESVRNLDFLTGISCLKWLLVHGVGLDKAAIDKFKRDHPYTTIWGKYGSGGILRHQNSDVYDIPIGLP